MAAAKRDDLAGHMKECEGPDGAVGILRADIAEWRSQIGEAMSVLSTRLTAVENAQTFDRGAKSHARSVWRLVGGFVGVGMLAIALLTYWRTADAEARRTQIQRSNDAAVATQLEALAKEVRALATVTAAK